MPLDQATLAATLVTNLQAAKDENWSLEQVASALAAAVAAFVAGADVSGVVVDVCDADGTSIGAGTQTNTVHPT